MGMRRIGSSALRAFLFSRRRRRPIQQYNARTSCLCSVNCGLWVSKAVCFRVKVCVCCRVKVCPSGAVAFLRKNSQYQEITSSWSRTVIVNSASRRLLRRAFGIYRKIKDHNLFPFHAVTKKLRHAYQYRCYVRRTVKPAFNGTWT